jgi:hypothetical protein
MRGVSNRNASIRGLIKQNPKIASAVIRFNSDFCTNLHPDRQSVLLPQLSSSSWQQPRLVERISKIIGMEIGLEDKFYLDIPNPLWAVILLPPERLKRLALHLGALVLGIRIRSSLSREHVMAWKNRLGEEAYRFAMNSASLLPSAQIPLPAIASDSAYAIGTSIIGAALAQEPEQLKKRVTLKFTENVAAMQLEPERARRLISLVMQIVEAEWHSLCVKIRVSKDLSQ